MRHLAPAVVLISGVGYAQMFRYSFDGAGICVAVDAPQPSAASIVAEPERKRKAR